MPLGREIGLGQGHIVLDGDPAPPPQKGHTPQFLAHVCCGQTGGWIKVPLGREVGLGPGHIVLDGDPPPSPKGAQPPIFGTCLLRPNGRPSQLLLSTCQMCGALGSLSVIFAELLVLHHIVLNSTALSVCCMRFVVYIGCE